MIERILRWIEYVELASWLWPVVVVAGTFLIVMLARWVLRGMKALESAGSMVPFRVKLIPSRLPKWIRHKRTVGLIKDLQAQGFEEAGSFSVRFLYFIRISILGYVHPITGTMAAITFQKRRPSVNLTTEYLDGSTYTVSSDPIPPKLKRPPNQPYRPIGLKPMTELLRILTSERPVGVVRPVQMHEFAERYEAHYAAEQDWHAERGGPSREELLLFHPGWTVEKNAEDLDIEHRMFSVAALKNWWSVQPGMPYPIDQIRDDLCVVTDDIPAEDLELIFDMHSESLEEYELKNLPQTPGRQRFVLLNQVVDSPMIKVHSKLTPLEADFYLPAAKYGPGRV